MLRVLVADDEPLARERLRRLLQGEPGIEIAAECGTGRETVAAIGREKPDVVFLDIQMPEGDGFDVVERIGPERMPAVVFVTAYDQYAVKAFEVHALDYLLKPFDREWFQETLRPNYQNAGEIPGINPIYAVHNDDLDVYEFRSDCTLAGGGDSSHCQLYDYEDAPRGSLGRTNDTVNIDLHGGYKIKMPKGLGIKLNLDIFNLFNEQPPPPSTTTSR